MLKFISAPDLVHGKNYVQVDSDEYYLTEPYVVHYQKGTTEFRLVIPAYLNTDFGTTPFRWFNESYMLPGYVVHDFLYYQNTNNGLAPWYFLKTLDGVWVEAVGEWNKKDSDKMMNALHHYKKAPWWKKTLVHKAVRVFGGPYWNS